MSQCGDFEDIHFYVINVFYGKVIAVYFLPLKNHPVDQQIADARCISQACSTNVLVPKCLGLQITHKHSESRYLV